MRKRRCRAEVAAARQLAMYLTHVMLGRTLTEVGALYGRDRTTVAYACAVIEDRRDGRFDAEVCRLESEIASWAEQAAYAPSEARHAVGQ